MNLLSALIDVGFRNPASCIITVGVERRSIGKLARQVKSVEIATSRKDAWSGAIVFEDLREADGRWIVADSGLFKRWERVSIKADFGTRTEEVFRGVVKGLKPNFPNNAGEATFEVSLQDESSLLDRQHMRKTWGKDVPTSDLQIMRDLVKDPLALSTDSGQGRQGQVLNQDATAIRFMRDRAEANGYELIFDQGKIYFGPMRLSGAPLPSLVVYGGRGTNCMAFSVDEDAMRPDMVTYDLAPEKEGSEGETATVKPNLELLGRTAVAEEGSSLPSPSDWRMSRDGDAPRSDTEAKAQALVNEHSLRLKASGEADGALYGNVLKPGRLVHVDGAGERYSGLYYIDQVGHSFTPDGYKQAFQLLRNATGGSTSPVAGIGGLSAALRLLF
jgi:hypothetical protein